MVSRKGMAVFKSLMRSYFRKTPSYLILFVTARCNARCKMCFYWRNIDDSSVKGELTLEEYWHISRKFKNLFYLSISGGEPMLREDLPEVVRAFYRNSGVRFVNITTNGGFPQRTLDVIKSILEYCPDIKVKLSFSLDGLGAKHDNIRGVKGLFDKVLESHKLLSGLNSKNLAINIATTFSSLNKDGIYELIDYVHNDLKINDHTVTYVRGDTRDKYAKDITPGEYFKVWNYVLDKNKNGNKGFFGIFNNLIRMMYRVNQETLERNRAVLPCLAGKKFITISEKGEVYPCEVISNIFKNKPFKMGNLRNFGYDINRILRAPQNRHMVDFIEKSKCHCSFECSTLCNIAFSKKNLFKIFNQK
ncbi:MAG: radical SAM protein [archaeon]